MPDPIPPQDRLQPALLDRLTDEEPEVQAEARERRVLSKAQLRQAVLRDLAWLFNSTRLERAAELAKTPYARRSVINFGLPSLSGNLVSSLEINGIEQAVRDAILDFEPRILPESLRVKALFELSELNQHSVIGVEIHGQLWAQPVPLELLIRTEIDLETGKAQLVDLASARAV